MQKTCPSLKLVGLMPSAGLTLKQKPLSGPRISSMEPTLDLFSRYTPLLNLGNLLMSVHLTTKLFSDLWRKVPQGMTQEGGPWSKPPRLLLNEPPRPRGAPRPPKEPRCWKEPPRDSWNYLPMKKDYYSTVWKGRNIISGIGKQINNEEILVVARTMVVSREMKGRICL